MKCEITLIKKCNVCVDEKSKVCDLGTTKFSTNHWGATSHEDGDGEQGLNTEHSHRESQAGNRECFANINNRINMSSMCKY